MIYPGFKTSVLTACLMAFSIADLGISLDAAICMTLESCVFNAGLLLPPSATENDKNNAYITEAYQIKVTELCIYLLVLYAVYMDLFCKALKPLLKDLTLQKLVAAYSKIYDCRCTRNILQQASSSIEPTVIYLQLSSFFDQAMYYVVVLTTRK